MDEPTAALGVRETAAVEALIGRLRDDDVTVLLISHDMAQVLRVADTVYVLRGGRTVARRTIADTDGDELGGLITGAVSGDVEEDPAPPPAAGEPAVQERSGGGAG